MSTTLLPETALERATEVSSDETPEPIQRRLLRPHTIASFLIAIVILGLLVQRMDIDLGEVWKNIRKANPAYFLAALVLYYSTFVARTYRWRFMLGQAGISRENGFRIPNIPHLFEILMLSWFANCVVPAKLGDGYRSYLLKRDSNAPASATLGTILAERLTDLSVLFVTMTIAGIAAFHGDMPSRAEKTVLFGAGMMALAAFGLIALFFAREFVLRIVPNRFVRHYHDFHDAVFSCLRRPALPIGVSIGIWAADGLRFYLVAKSLGADLSFTLTIFVSLMSALLTTLPFTPAGLGLVEAAVIVVLGWVHVNSAMAGSIAILDRVIGYWSLILVGLVLYLHRMRREVRADRVT